MGSRAWWDDCADWAAWAVAAGVVLESVTSFDTLARLMRLGNRETLRKRIEKLGLLILISGLVAEVLIRNRVRERTDIIESALSTSLRDTIAANADLDRKIKLEQSDIRSMSGDVENLWDETEDLSGDLDDIANGMSGLQAGQRTLETRQSGAERRLGALGERTTSLSSSLDTEQSRVAKANEEIDEAFQTMQRRHIRGHPELELGRYAGSVVYLWWPRGDDEAANLKRETADTFTKSGWTVLEVPEKDADPTYPDEGVRIAFNSETGTGGWDEVLTAKARAVCRMFRQSEILGVKFEPGGAEYAPASKAHTLVVRIGRQSEQFLSRHAWEKQYPKVPWPGLLPPELSKLIEAECAERPK